MYEKKGIVQEKEMKQRKEQTWEARQEKYKKHNKNRKEKREYENKYVDADRDGLNDASTLQHYDYFVKRHNA